MYDVPGFEDGLLLSKKMTGVTKKDFMWLFDVNSLEQFVVLLSNATQSCLCSLLCQREIASHAMLLTR